MSYEVKINDTKYHASQNNPYSNEWHAVDENYDAEHDGFDWNSESHVGSGDTKIEALIDLLANYDEFSDEQYNYIVSRLKAGATEITA